LKSKRLNCNDSSFQVLGAFGNLSFGKLRRCFYQSELSRWNLVRVNHLIRLQQPMSDPMNEPSREPIREPTKRMDSDAVLPNNLSPKKT
jgi:hypothetical protein